MTIELQQPNQNKEDPQYLYRYFDEMSNEGEYLYLDLVTSGQLDSNANCRHPIFGTFHALKKAAKYIPSIGSLFSPN